MSPEAGVPAASPARAVHQLVPTAGLGRRGGQPGALPAARCCAAGASPSEIYADQWDEELPRPGRAPPEDLPQEAGEDAVLLIHHSFESRLVPLIARSPGRKALVYHNVTPGPALRGFRAARWRAACEAAREELLALRPLVECAVRLLALQRRGAGRRRASRTCPCCPSRMDWSAFDAPPDPDAAAELDDGCANVLFVGRAVPSKRVDDVLRVFTAYQRLYQPRSRLLIAGYLNRERPYGAWLHGVRGAAGPGARPLPGPGERGAAVRLLRRGHRVPVHEPARGLRRAAAGGHVPGRAGGGLWRRGRAGDDGRRGPRHAVARPAWRWRSCSRCWSASPPCARRWSPPSAPGWRRWGRTPSPRPVREALRPLLEGRLRRPTASASPAMRVELVCPASSLAPGGPRVPARAAAAGAAARARAC